MSRLAWFVNGVFCGVVCLFIYQQIVLAVTPPVHAPAQPAPVVYQQPATVLYAPR
jgi:hypothetical protein